MLAKLRGVFRRRPVIFAYLFGSRARGRPRASSDVDLAVYLSRALSVRARESLRLRLLGEACAALGRDDVDLVILNDAGPLLAFRVIESGKPVFSKDELARVRFEARAMALYYDRLPASMRSADLMLERVASGRLLH